jgi:GcrA cell cycle regulator
MTLGWNDERVETLRKLWTDGLSASQIAKQLGGVTRNAVIGKVHRLGLAGRATPSRPAKRPMRIQRPARPINAMVPNGQQRPRTHALTIAPQPFVPAPPPLQAMAQPDGSLASVLTLTEKMCKWPIGDPNDNTFAFCGRSADCGPYCQEHAQHAYQPSRAPKRKVASEPDELRRMLRVASR